METSMFTAQLWRSRKQRVITGEGRGLLPSTTSPIPPFAPESLKGYGMTPFLQLPLVAISLLPFQYLFKALTL